MNRENIFISTGLVLAVLIGANACGGGGGGSTEESPPEPIAVVSENSSAVSGSGNSSYSTISGDGRYVGFSSVATNLVTGDTNGASDIFVRDMDTGIMARVSVSTSGTEANGPSYDPDISADGRYVAFESDASNLVQGDNNVTRDVFVHDIVAGSTSRISVSSAGVEANGYSQNPSISPDGNYVAFESVATNLATGDTNNVRDIYVHSMQAGSTFRVSFTSSGQQANANCTYPDISSVGPVVVFYSGADNLIPGDLNNRDDVFVRDVYGALTSRVSVSTAGSEGNDGSYDPKISADGTVIVFESDAANFDSTDNNSNTDVFVRNRSSGETKRISLGDSFSGAPEVSADGRYVVYRSTATDLVTGDTNGFEDVFVYDRDTGETSLVSVAADGTQGDAQSRYPQISADNQYITFESIAENLVPGADDYLVWQIYRAPRP